MQHPAHLVATLYVALVCCAGAVPRFATAQQAPVVAQELNKVRASGKVLAALWTVRSDSYTLQLVLPVSTTASLQPTRIQASRQSSAVPPSPQPAKVQVWLLEPDGTQVLPTRQSPAPTSQQLSCGRCISYEFAYSFPLAAGREAVAAAVRINDDFYIEQLAPLGNEKE